MTLGFGYAATIPDDTLVSSDLGRETMTRLAIQIHTDESGRFQATDPRSGETAWDGEPFLLAGIVTEGAFSPEQAHALWNGLGLGPASEFHAAERADRQRLNAAARTVLRHLGAQDTASVVSVAHRYLVSQGLPRPSVYLDLVTHLTVEAVRGAVHAATARTDWSGLVPLKVELNLARREGLNLRPLEKSLARAISRDLRQSRLARRHGAKRGEFLKRGVNADAIHVHCSVIPVQQSLLLTLSDLLCNFLFRGLARDDARAETLVRLINADELRFLNDAEWSAVMADDPVGPIAPRAIPQPVEGLVSLTERIAALGDAPNITSVGAVRAGGVWPQTESPSDRSAAMRDLLRQAEDACERRRDLDAADARGTLVTALLDDPAWRKGIEPTELEALELGRDSLRLSVANHRGLPLPGWFDKAAVDGRSARLAGQPAHLDAVALLHNRLAVNALNRFDFETAARDCEGLVAVLRTKRAGFGAFFGSPTASSREFGALLGTAGQSLALHGYLTRDRDLIERAIGLFFEAGNQFSAPEDKRRQCSYLAHAHLDLLRIVADEGLDDGWFDLLDLMGEELDTDVAAFCAAPGGDDAWRHAFAVHVRLKQAWLLGETPDWAGPLAASFGATANDGPLPHPKQQVAGLLALLLDLPSDHALVHAVQRTSGAGNTLVHVIARVYALDLAGDEARSPATILAFLDRLPSWLRPGWDGAGMTKALESALDAGAPFVDALPFYYF